MLKKAKKADLKFGSDYLLDFWFNAFYFLNHYRCLVLNNLLLEKESNASTEVNYIQTDYTISRGKGLYPLKNLTPDSPPGLPHPLYTPKITHLQSLNSEIIHCACPASRISVLKNFMLWVGRFPIEINTKIR